MAIFLDSNLNQNVTTDAATGVLRQNITEDNYLVNTTDLKTKELNIYKHQYVTPEDLDARDALIEVIMKKGRSESIQSHLESHESYDSPDDNAMDALKKTAIMKKSHERILYTNLRNQTFAEKAKEPTQIDLT